MSCLPFLFRQTAEAQSVEQFRNREYPQLKGKVYLDHGGTTLYAKSLMDHFHKDMTRNLYGNPHSASTPSVRASRRVEAVRDRALRFFDADPGHWDLIFVSNATAAIKLVGECFRDYAVSESVGFFYGYHGDAHTSLVGVRELAHEHICLTSDADVEQWICRTNTDAESLSSTSAALDAVPLTPLHDLTLFGYPGQSNMTGRRLPLHWYVMRPEKKVDLTEYLK